MVCAFDPTDAIGEAIVVAGLDTLTIFVYCFDEIINAFICTDQRG